MNEPADQRDRDVDGSPEASEYARFERLARILVNTPKSAPVEPPREPADDGAEREET